MSYNKTNWNSGDIITAEKLNKIEDGIENSLSEKLQALYKTMVGNDWPYENNPTDAEVIDAIAKDATGGGSSGGSDDDEFKAIILHSDGQYPTPHITDFDSWDEFSVFAQDADDNAIPIVVKNKFGEDMYSFSAPLNFMGSPDDSTWFATGAKIYYDDSLSGKMALRAYKYTFASADNGAAIGFTQTFADLATES